MLMAGGSHHPTISALSSAGSTMAATAGGGAAEPASRAARAAMERSGPLRCPRCSSSNTKFCYYNNYSLCQPRHFCKACKRYWTRGGTLRNVPVGGGCRKNKRPKKPITSSSTATTSSAADPAAPKPPHSSRLLPTPIATAPSSASSSNLGPLFYGHASDARPIAFPHPCVSYNQQQSLGQLFPYDHQIIQQLPGCATPSLASLLHDYSLLESNPATSLHGSSLRQQQQQQRTTQNPNLSRYTTLLSPITSETSALPNDVVKMEADREWQTSGSTNQCGRFIWQVPSCESAVLETVAAESMSSFYWNAGAASAFGGGALQ